MRPEALETVLLQNIRNWEMLKLVQLGVLEFSSFEDLQNNEEKVIRET